MRLVPPRIQEATLFGRRSSNEQPAMSKNISEVPSPSSPRYPKPFHDTAQQNDNKAINSKQNDTNAVVEFSRPCHGGYTSEREFNVLNQPKAFRKRATICLLHTSVAEKGSSDPEVCDAMIDCPTVCKCVMLRKMVDVACLR